MKNLLTAIICLLVFSTLARAEDVAVIVAKDVPLDNATLDQISSIFLGDTSKVGGVDLTIVTRQKGTPERSAVLKTVYQLSDAAFEQYFMQAVFVGKMSSPPRMIPSAIAMRHYVAANPGVVGYLKVSDLDPTVKAVKIDGHAPSDPSYPIKAP